MKNALIKHITTNDITFLLDIDKSININKKGKSYYSKSFKIEYENIKNFILNLNDNEIYLINSFITVSCKLARPSLNLSRQFLLTNQSNPSLVTNFLQKQFKFGLFDFGIEDINEGNYWLVFKYKKVIINDRIY